VPPLPPSTPALLHPGPPPYPPARPRRRPPENLAHAPGAVPLRQVRNAASSGLGAAAAPRGSLPRSSGHGRERWETNYASLIHTAPTCVCPSAASSHVSLPTAGGCGLRPPVGGYDCRRCMASSHARATTTASSQVHPPTAGPIRPRQHPTNVRPPDGQPPTPPR
jgi:hypothetical protein